MATETEKSPPRKRAPRKAAAAPADVLLDSTRFTSKSAQSSGQVRVAEQFADRYRGRLMHVDGIGWHEWAGSHWKRVPDKRAQAAAQHLLKILLHEAVELEPADRDQWFHDVRRCESAAGLQGVAIIAAGMPGISVAPELVDEKPDLVAFTNGTYELQTDVFRDADPRDYLTKVMGCAYDPTAECPAYDGQLEWAQPDPDVRAYLHRQVGSALEGRVRDHMLPINSGTGGNGKGSTLNDSWLPCFGDYGTTLPVEVLLASQGKDYMTERLTLKGARLVITSEPPANAKLNAALSKLIAGGDVLKVRPLRSNHMIEWEPTHQAFMMCNFRPEPPADDRGVWRRLKPVEWTRQLADTEMDGNLPTTLRGELAGIANRILEGWRDYRDNAEGHDRLRVPEVCRADAKAWQASVDTLQQFLDDCCDVGAGLKVRSGALFAKWESFCADMNIPAGSQVAFTAAMKVKRFQTKRSGGMWFVGLDVLPAEIHNLYAPDDMAGMPA